MLKRRNSWKESRKVNRWPHRLSVRTPGFHPGKRGSTPLGATDYQKTIALLSGGFLVLVPKESRTGRCEASNEGEIGRVSTDTSERVFGAALGNEVVSRRQGVTPLGVISILCVAPRIFFLKHIPIERELSCYMIY